MLRIAVVTRYFPSSAEPAQGRFAYQTLRVLARTEEVRVFYPNAVYPAFLTPPRRLYTWLDPSFRLPGVDVRYYDYLAFPLLSRPLNGFAISRLLLPQIRAWAPDLIVSYFLYPEGYAALRIARALSVPVVAVGIGSDINRRSDPITALHKRAVLRGADFLVTVSEDLRRKAIAMGAPPETSCAILNGCDPAVFRIRDRKEARRKLGLDLLAEQVLYLGRMDVKKGLRELVDAAVALHSQRPRLRVHLVGDGPDRGIVENAIRAHHAAHYIHLAPGCHFDAVATWMAAADLLVLPSYMEGSPNVVREALACGRPVVATNVGGIPEILSPDCGRLVPPRNSAALARALADVLDANWNPAAIAARCSRSWETVACELQSLFETLVGGRRAAALTD